MNEIEARGKIKYRIANEMRKYGENKEEYEDLEIALQVMKELREYRELGSVEELKDLKEKATPKEPLLVPTDDTCLYYEHRCPSCGEWLSSISLKKVCCCGQTLDWE